MYAGCSIQRPLGAPRAERNEAATARAGRPGARMPTARAAPGAGSAGAHPALPGPAPWAAMGPSRRLAALAAPALLVRVAVLASPRAPGAGAHPLPHAGPSARVRYATKMSAAGGLVYPPPIVYPPQAKHTATVIVLHGLGCAGTKLVTSSDSCFELGGAHVLLTYQRTFTYGCCVQ